jgi:hypothetical protein
MSIPNLACPPATGAIKPILIGPLSAATAAWLNPTAIKQVKRVIPIPNFRQFFTLPNLRTLNLDISSSLLNVKLKPPAVEARTLSPNWHHTFYSPNSMSFFLVQEGMTDPQPSFTELFRGFTFQAFETEERTRGPFLAQLCEKHTFVLLFCKTSFVNTNVNFFGKKDIPPRFSTVSCGKLKTRNLDVTVLRISRIRT